MDVAPLAHQRLQAENPPVGHSPCGEDISQPGERRHLAGAAA